MIWAGIDAVPLVATICRLLRPRTGRALIVMPIGGRGAESIFLNEAKQQGLVHLDTLTLPCACAEPTCPPAALFSQLVSGDLGGNLNSGSQLSTKHPQNGHVDEVEAALQEGSPHALGSEVVNSDLTSTKDKDNTEDYHLHVFMCL